MPFLQGGLCLIRWLYSDGVCRRLQRVCGPGEREYYPTTFRTIPRPGTTLYLKGHGVTRRCVGSRMTSSTLTTDPTAKLGGAISGTLAER